MTYQEAVEQILKNSERITRETEKEIIKISSATNNELKTITENYYTKMRDAGTPPEEYYNYSTRSSRLDKLLTGVTVAYVSGAKKISKSQINNGYKVITSAYYQNKYIVDFVAKSPLKYLNPIIQEISVTGSQKAWEELSKQVRDRITNVYGNVKNYYPQYGTLNSVLLNSNAKTIEALRTTIIQGLRNGKTHIQVAKGIQDIIKTSVSNAIRIARTEGTRNTNAASTANSEALKSQGFAPVRQWLATLDGRTRASHARADGQQEDKDGLFHVGGATGSAPGNMDSASQSVNCRCTTLTIIDGVQPGLRSGRDPVTKEVSVFKFKTFDQWTKDNNLTWTSKGWLPK